MRRLKGWKREELAEFAIISISTVRNIEGNKTRTRRFTAEKVATTLGAELDALSAEIGGDEVDSSTCGFDDPTARQEPAVSASVICDACGGADGDRIRSLLSVDDGLGLIARIVTMMPRRDVLLGLGAAVLAGLGNMPSCQADAVESARYGLAGGRIGPEVPKWATDQVKHLKWLDVQVGGKELYQTASSNLILLQTLLHNRAARGSDEHELRVALAQTACQAGWFAEDAEMLDVAAQHYHFGIEIARSAGDRDNTVYGLTRLAAVELARGNPKHCLSQLEAAEAEAGIGSPWRSFILMFAVEAHGRIGDCKAANLALAKADALVDKRDPDCMGDWVWSRIRPSSSAVPMRGFLEIDPQFTAKLSEAALAHTLASAKFVRSRLHLQMILAKAKCACGDLDFAVNTASDVLASVKSTPMPRVEKQLFEFSSRLPDAGVAQDFRKRVIEYKRSIA